jgi:hypothetical protein
MASRTRIYLRAAELLGSTPEACLVVKIRWRSSAGKSAA